MSIPCGAPRSGLGVVRNEELREPGRHGRGGAFTHPLISRRVRHMQNSVGQDLRRKPGERGHNPAYPRQGDEIVMERP